MHDVDLAFAVEGGEVESWTEGEDEDEGVERADWEMWEGQIRGVGGGRVDVDEGEGGEEMQDGEEGMNESPFFVTEQRVDGDRYPHCLTCYSEPWLACSCALPPEDEIEAVQDEGELSEGHEWEGLGEVEMERVGAVEKGDRVEDILVEEAEGRESWC